MNPDATASAIAASTLLATFAVIGMGTVGFIAFACARELAERMANTDVREVVGDVMALAGVAADKVRAR
jgi:threonine dehydrogenase-like Zn-dependent dehydrogenase